MQEMTAGWRSFLENNKQFSNIHLRHRSVSLTTFSEYSILNTINVSISQVIGSKTQIATVVFCFPPFSSTRVRTRLTVDVCVVCVLCS